MAEKQVAVLDQNQQKIFAEDTRKLGMCTSNYIQSFYPSYSVNNALAVSSPQENSLDLLNSFTFYKICECTIYNVDDRLEYFSEKMKKLFISAYSIKQEVCYGIVSSEGKTSIVLGVAPTSKDAIIKTLVEGLLPGVRLEQFQDRFVNSKESCNWDAKDKDRYVGCICGVPALMIDGQLQKKDLSSLMRSLNGQNYTIMVMCKPVDEFKIQEKINQAIKIQDECFAISKRTLSLQEGSSYGSTHADNSSETHGENKSKNGGFNLSGALPGMLAGAAIGAAAGTPVPFIGNAIGLVGGGLIGLVAGQQLNFNKGSSKGTSHSITEGYSDAISNTVNSGKSISADIQNGFALDLMKMAESMTERLKVGRNIGMWESVLSYSSDSKIASEVIQGSLYSEMASRQPDVLPPVVFSYRDTCNGFNLPVDKIHNQQLMIPKGFFSDTYESPISSLVTSEELCAICTIPTENIAGFEIREAKGYPLNYHQQPDDKTIGLVCEYERPLPNMPFGLSEYDLNKHTFVCGITGSGKTNTVKKILKAVDKPFLVIEPAKKEYRNIEKKVDVYTLGRPEINCPKINPFYILPGISPQQHIDMLKDLFSASFAFYGPMPYILEKCLYNIYTKRGWNLTLGFHPCLVNAKSQLGFFDETKMRESYGTKGHKYVFPTMQDLKDEIDYYIENEMTYEGEVKGNIRGAIKARIDSLCVGAKGYMFNTHDMLDMNMLLKNNSILELEGLADDADKAFALGLLIIYVNEYRQVRKEIDYTKGLQHLLVIEEAHRLLKNVSTENNEDLGNPKGKAVEHFTNMLAEMRSYGQGVIVAEQIPNKLAPDVIKNSSNKIIHRIIAKDDQEVIANTIGIQLEDALSLGNSKVGYALCHKEGMVQPVIVKIGEVGSRQVMDVNLYNKDIDDKMFRINQSMIDNQMSDEITKWGVKALVSLLYMPEKNQIYDGLEVAYDRMLHLSVIKSITMIPGVDKKKCVLQSMANTIVSLMISGVFSNKKLPDDELVTLIQDTVQTPTETRLKQLQHKFEQFYGKLPAKKAVETVAGLYVEEYKSGANIGNAVTDYGLFKNEKFSNEVITYLKEKVK